MLSAILVSIYKPLLFGMVAGLWAFVASHIDKDLDYYYLKRTLWNLILLGMAVLALGLWLMIPIFWIGFPVAVIVIISVLVGYHFYRNGHVPPSAKWSFDLDSFRAQWDESQRKKAQRAAVIRVMDKDGQMVDVPTGDDPLVAVFEALENILDFALPRRAERIDMLATANETVVAVQIDGVKYPQTKLDSKTGVTMIDFIKKHAGMDVEDRRKRQEGKMRVLHDASHEVMAMSHGSTRGLSLTLLIDPTALRSMKFKDLGLLDTQQEQVASIFDEQDRAVLVVSPPHQGMTTTLYSFVNEHDPYMTNIMSLEDEVHFELEGVSHGQIKTGQDSPTIAKQLESMLLREPKVVLLSQLTDADTAKLIGRFADEARFYMGLRQKDSFTALKAWVKATGDKELAGHALRAIVAQRLLRKLCETCRVAYKPDPKLLKKLNLPVDKVSQLYKHSGKVMVKEEEQTCPDCMGLGYRGRRAVFEVMLFDDECRKLIADGQLDQLKNRLRKNRMLYMQEAALNLAAQGITSVSEISRVLAGDQ
jgi:type II secretory ATPase GspE/PulE/Tfp pilus assembly ATPase PilB-like protein